MSIGTTKTTWALAGVITLAGLGGWYWMQQPGSITLRLHAVADGQPLRLSEYRYRNPGGKGEFRVRDFQFYLSNVRLVADEGVYEPAESYHLARFDNETVSHEIVFDNVPSHDYHRVEFGLGVDPEANGSIRSVGDLDPNGRMAWSWEVGYKFILFEGSLRDDGTIIPLVYHVGFDENYIPLAFSTEAAVTPMSNTDVEFSVDVLRMFTSEATIDMRALSNVKFDRNDARLIARNLHGMIVPRESVR